MGQNTRTLLTGVSDFGWLIVGAGIDHATHPARIAVYLACFKPNFPLGKSISD